MCDEFRQGGINGDYFGPERYMDTTNLVIGITNVRFKLYHFYNSGVSSWNGPYNFAPINLDKIKVDVEIMDPTSTAFYHKYMPGTTGGPILYNTKSIF